MGTMAKLSAPNKTLLHQALGYSIKSSVIQVGPQQAKPPPRIVAPTEEEEVGPHTVARILLQGGGEGERL
jgi:hypothetical protein